MAWHNPLCPKERKIKFINKLKKYTFETLSTFLYPKLNAPFVYLFSLFA